MQSWSSQDGDLLGSEAPSARVLTLVKHRAESLEIICFLGSRIVREGRESVERALAHRPRSRQRKPGLAGAGRARVRALAPGSMTALEAGCGIFQEELNFGRF